MPFMLENLEVYQKFIDLAFWAKSLLTNQTFWTAVGAVCTAICALGVILVQRQLRLSAWANAQEIFMAADFVSARTVVLQYFDEPIDREPSAAAKVAAKLVCRRMDGLCRLVEKHFLSKRQLFKYWLHPIGKCWIVVQERWHIIATERQISKGHIDKWEAFYKYAMKAARRIRKKDQI